MHYNDHAPAHFHAHYAGREMLVNIDTLQSMRGRLAQRAECLVLDWAALHQQELIENWLARARGRTLKPIEPLE